MQIFKCGFGACKDITPTTPPPVGNVPVGYQDVPQCLNASETGTGGVAPSCSLTPVAPADYVSRPFNGTMYQW